MTLNDGQPVTPYEAAKLIYVAFGEQAEVMGTDETLDFIGVADASKLDKIKVVRMVVKTGLRVRRMLGL